jgi:hypothetical protein
MATKLTSLKVGGGFAAGVIAGLTAGQLLLGGDIVTDSTQDASPSLKLNSGAYLTYQEEALVQSGSLSHYKANIAPAFQSGVLLRAHVECRQVSQAINADLGITNTAVESGSNIWDNRPLSTDSVLVFSSGSFIWDQNEFLSVTTSSGASASPDCKLKVWSSQVYDG